MITGTFNGRNVVALPTSPAFSQMTFTLQDSIGKSRSPFTGQSQFYDWGTDWWEASASLPPLTRPEAQAWMAFLAESRGIGSCFLVGDPLAKSLGHTHGSMPQTDGVNAQRSTTLQTRGWQPNALRLLLPGDYLQIGYRLHMNLNLVESDAQGKATLHLWPRLREAPTDGTSIVLSQPKGLFRLAENKRSYSLAVTQLFGISLQLEEAL